LRQQPSAPSPPRPPLKPAARSATTSSTCCSATEELAATFAARDPRATPLTCRSRSQRGRGLRRDPLLCHQCLRISPSRRTRAARRSGKQARTQSMPLSAFIPLGAWAGRALTCRSVRRRHIRRHAQ
jgi:hypothetical protein